MLPFDSIPGNIRIPLRTTSPNGSASALIPDIMIDTLPNTLPCADAITCINGSSPLCATGFNGSASVYITSIPPRADVAACINSSSTQCATSTNDSASASSLPDMISTPPPADAAVYLNGRSSLRANDPTDSASA